MEALFASIEQVIAFDGALLTAVMIAALWFITTSLVAAGIPGVLIPATLATEAVAGPVAATATVSMGGNGRQPGAVCPREALGRSVDGCAFR